MDLTNKRDFLISICAPWMKARSLLRQGLLVGFLALILVTIETRAMTIIAPLFTIGILRCRIIRRVKILVNERSIRMILCRGTTDALNPVIDMRMILISTGGSTGVTSGTWVPVTTTN